MEETLRQLGGLVLGAIPTIVLFLVVYVAYRFLVHNPLERILGERHARTEGAMERARAEIATAEARAAEYEERLRTARIAVFKAQEARRQRALEARAAVVAEARQAADAHVRVARAGVEQDVAAAKAGLQADAERLAAEVVRSILRPVAVPAGGAE